MGRLVRVELADVPATWTEIYRNPSLAIQNVTIETIGVSNDAGLGSVIHFRINGVVTLTRSVPADTTYTYLPNIILAPGDNFEVSADDVDRLDVYAVGVRGSEWNSWGMSLLPNVTETPQLIYEMPLNAGHELLIEGIVASRVTGTPPAEVDVWVEEDDGTIVTLLTGTVSSTGFIFILSRVILKRGDKVFTSAQADNVIDVNLIWKIG